MQVDQTATIWTAVGGVLVFLMIPAIGMLEAGFVRRVNAISALSKGLLAFAVFLPIWFAVFPLYFGGVLVDGFYPTGADAGIPWPVYAFFLGVFGAVTLALIAVGAPERLKFGGWVLFSIFFSAVQWPLVASWIWGGGFLARLGSITGWAPGLGVRDFAGGTVVHAYAGLAGLMATLVLGPSLRRRAGDGVQKAFAYKESLEYKYSELPYGLVGTALLYFGWFGFNAGSALAPNVQMAYALVNTAVAGSLAGALSVALSKLFDGVWSPVALVGGLLGGLVAITPLAGFIDVPFSFLVGALAALTTYFGTKFVERYYSVDDPVGSLPVHGFNGVLGSALVSVLAYPPLAGAAGLIYGGSPGWVATQLLGMAVALGFVSATTYGFFKALTALGLRASLEEELVGLDVVDHGVERI
ncbi:MAG: ammonium transporter [Thermoproteus sp.]